MLIIADGTDNSEEYSSANDATTSTNLQRELSRLRALAHSAELQRVSSRSIALESLTTCLLVKYLTMKNKVFLILLSRRVISVIEFVFLPFDLKTSASFVRLCCILQFWVLLLNVLPFFIIIFFKAVVDGFFSLLSLLTAFFFFHIANSTFMASRR